MGCSFKDWNFSIGLVDFPAVIDGETVFLCCRSDEGKLAWYHRIEDGYQRRRPLPETQASRSGPALGTYAALFSSRLSSAA